MSAAYSRVRVRGGARRPAGPPAAAAVERDHPVVPGEEADLRLPEPRRHDRPGRQQHHGRPCRVAVDARRRSCDAVPLDDARRRPGPAGLLGCVAHPSSVRLAGCSRASRPDLEHVVERRRSRRSGSAVNPAAVDDVADPGRPGLRAEREPDVLATATRACTAASRSRSTPGRPVLRLSSTWSPAIGSTTIHVPSSAIALAHVPGRADRVAHVVQAVEHRDQVVAGAGEARSPGRPRTSRGPRRPPPRPARARSRSTPRGSPSRRTSTFGNALASRIVDAPCPQPTSATGRPPRAWPRRRRAPGSTPSSRCAVVHRCGRSARTRRARRRCASCQPSPSPSRAASSRCRGASRTVPSASWKKPGR